MEGVRPRSRRPRPAPAGRPAARARRARRRGRLASSSAGCTFASSGAWPSTTRSGSRPSTVAHGERRVVGAHGAGADEHGVALGPQAVGVAPGRGSPVIHWLGAVGCRGAPVERGRQLEHDVRPAGAAVLQVRRELGPHLVRAHADRRPRCPRPAAARCPAPADVRVGIFDADDDPRDAGRDDRVGARRGAAVVRAGLERREERRPARPVRRPPAGRRPRREDHPAARWRRRTCRRSGVSTTHPTHGFGDVRLRAPAAAAIARCIRWCSLALVLTASSVRDQGSRSVHEDADTTAGARQSAAAPSLPSGLTASACSLARRHGTPSALGFHQVGQRPEGRRFAGSHRRSGLTPIPREGWHFVRLRSPSDWECTHDLVAGNARTRNDRLAPVTSETLQLAD